jgi:hypothetical protein
MVYYPARYKHHTNTLCTFRNIIHGYFFQFIHKGDATQMDNFFMVQSSSPELIENERDETICIHKTNENMERKEKERKVGNNKQLMD